MNLKKRDTFIVIMLVMVLTFDEPDTALKILDLLVG